MWTSRATYFYHVNMFLPRRRLSTTSATLSVAPPFHPEPVATAVSNIVEAVWYGIEFIVRSLHRICLLLNSSNSTEEVVSTLVSDEIPPYAIDQTTQFRAANDKWVSRLVESFKKSESFLSISPLGRRVGRYFQHCSSQFIVCIRQQRPLSHWRLARSHAATAVPFATNEKTDDGPVPFVVNCPCTGRAQRTPSESCNIPDRAENSHCSVPPACATILNTLKYYYCAVRGYRQYNTQIVHALLQLSIISYSKTDCVDDCLCCLPLYWRSFEGSF